MKKLTIEIPKEFLEEEIRCGFKVTKEIKEIWAVELDLFAEFDRVCKKYGLKYVASGGTLLGAVRHKGFIPWDDDMDLMMMRNEYDRFCKVASQEFKPPYFFQTEETDPGFRRRFARIRNSLTTGILKRDIIMQPTYNQGIFIDIFPLDNVIGNKELYKKQCQSYKKYKKLSLALRVIEDFPPVYSKDSFKYWFKLLLHFLIGHISHYFQWSRKAFDKSNIICQQYNDKECEYISLLTLDIKDLRHALRKTTLDKIVYTDFEFLKIPIIAEFDEHLRHKYGDYMVMKKDPNLHGDIIFDTNTPYTEYKLNASHQ